MENKTLTQIVVSVYGPHAGEDETSILSRKMEDIRKAGFTLWLYNKTNRYARPLDVQAKARDNSQPNLSLQEVWLIHPSSKGGAGDTTKMPLAMREMSADGVHYTPIDARLTPVTGSHDGFAFVISKIDIVSGCSIDLSKFADPSNSNVGFKIGNSTQIVHSVKSALAGEPMKKPVRAVWAICTLASPYCVFVR